MSGLVIRTSDSNWVTHHDGIRDWPCATLATQAAYAASKINPAIRVSVYRVVNALPEWHVTYKNGKRLFNTAKTMKAGA